MRLRRKSAGGPPEHSSAAASGEYFQLGLVRLYQPDSILKERLPEAAELASYCKTLTWVGREYFGRLGQDFGSMGILIAVGIKPGQRIKLWYEQVDGDIPRMSGGSSWNCWRGPGKTSFRPSQARWRVRLSVFWAQVHLAGSR